MSKSMDRLLAAKQRAEQQREKAESDLKELKRQISTQARRDRNHTIYERGGELTRHLGDDTGVLTASDVRMLLNFIFCIEKVRVLLDLMLAIRRGEKEGTVEALFSDAVESDGVSAGGNPAGADDGASTAQQPLTAGRE